jgi:hypothetical protein
MLRRDRPGRFDLYQRRVDIMPVSKARFAQCDWPCWIDSGIEIRIECFGRLRDLIEATNLQLDAESIRRLDQASA